MTVQPLGRAELTDALALVHLTQPLCRVGVGVPSHVPSVPVRTLPSFGVPVTTGYLVPLIAGGRPTASVDGVNTEDDPATLLAKTLIWMYLLRSASTSVYDVALVVPITEQPVDIG